jgi:uncharacterized membrane protein
MKRVVVRLKVRTAVVLALVLAGIVLIIIGADLVLFPFGDRGQMQDNVPVGLEASIRLGTGLLVAGVVLLVAGLVGFAIARSRSPASPAPPAAGVRDPEATPPAPSSEVEAAVVKLLDEDEKLLYTRLRAEDREVLQRDIVAWGTFSAPKVSRLLDRLETKGLVVRERHGMTNRVRLTHRRVVPAK